MSEVNISDLNEIYERLIAINTQILEIQGNLNSRTPEESSKKLTEMRIGFMEVYMMSRRVIAVLRRMGMGEDADAALSKIRTMIMAFVQLRRAINTLYAATGPYGWIMGGLEMAITLSEVGELASDFQGMNSF